MSSLDDIVQVGRHDGEGYRPVIDSDGEWIVALMNFCESVTLAELGKIEKHLNTDEVFVLTAGRGALVLGGRGGGEPGRLHVVAMEHNVVYNVKREVWHGLVLSEDARTMIVERRNPETVPVKPTPAHIAEIRPAVERALAGEELPFPPVSRFLAVGRHTAPGYAAVIDSDLDWIAAVINGGSPAVSLTPQKTLAYHPDTDEVFLLTRGKNALLVAPPGEEVKEVTVLPMEPNVAYNVKRGTWHASVMSEDATMLVAEGRDPASVTVSLTPRQVSAIEGRIREVLGDCTGEPDPAG